MLFGSLGEGRRGDGTKAREEEEEAEIRRLCGVLVWLFWPYSHTSSTPLDSMNSVTICPLCEIRCFRGEVVFNPPLSKPPLNH